jgi:hypothetical protein
VDRRGKAAERVNLAVGRGDGEMIARLRQRRRGAPSVGLRIVCVVSGDRFVVRHAAERMELAAKRNCGHFGAHRRQRCLHGPRAGRSLTADLIGGGQITDYADEQDSNDRASEPHRR